MIDFLNDLKKGNYAILLVLRRTMRPLSRSKGDSGMIDYSKLVIASIFVSAPAD